MANPRKFTEKIARLKQNDEEGRRAFEQVMKVPVSMLEVLNFYLLFSVLILARCNAASY